MKSRITAITLGVADFRRSLEFYKNGMGWPTSATGDDEIAFFELPGTVLALFERGKLAEDAGVPSEGNGFSGITLAINTSGEKEVDEIISHVRSIGGKIVKEPQKVFWGGYSSYFSDPDGFLWEVVYNPNWKVDENGMVIK